MTISPSSDTYQAVLAGEAANPRLRDSTTFTTFLTFMGDVPFAPSEQFWSQMKELDAQEIQWVSTLEEHETNTICKQDRLIRGNTFLSMGPLEGSLEWWLASRGAARVVALEGYRSNYLKCRIINTIFPSLPLEFVEADAMNMPGEPGEFDVILCWGVFYHLHEPHMWLEAVKALKPCLVLIGTQLAVDPPHPAFMAKGLSEPGHVELNGKKYQGRWFAEERHETYRSALDLRPSFWFYPDELRRLFEDLGFLLLESSLTDFRAGGLTGRFVLIAPDRPDWPATIRSWATAGRMLGLLPRRHKICRVDLLAVLRAAGRKRLRRIVRSAASRQ
jgi:SAM-dependent methyltransferase